MRYKNKINPNEIITKKQAVAYGIIAYYTQLKSAIKFQSCKSFAEGIITMMKLHTPQEAEERADGILNRP